MFLFYLQPFTIWNIYHIIILTNGFIKKARKTPVKEIALAKNRKMDYLKRK